MITKKGFTLSEVMVTLGLLGVLAAILIPAVMNTAPDTNRILFKKGYSTLEKTVSTLISDDMNYPATATDGAGHQIGFNNNVVGGTAIPGGTDKFCYLFSQSLNTLGTANCPANGTASFTTTDGILWYMTTNSTANTEFPLAATSWFLVDIDVNGTAKKPNCYDASVTTVPANSSAPIIPGAATCAGTTTPDIYHFGIRYDGKIQVYGNTAISILSNPTKNQK